MLCDAECARLAGVSATAWSRRWAPRVDQIARVLELRVELVEEHVRRHST